MYVHTIKYYIAIKKELAKSMKDFLAISFDEVSKAKLITSCQYVCVNFKRNHT